MFNRLMDFSYTRNWKEAVGFYLAFMLVGLLLTSLAGAVFSLTNPNGTETFSEGFKAGVRVGVVVMTLYCLAISCVILVQKKLYKNFGYVLLALASGIAGVFGGAILGLLIPAFLTTKTSSLT